MKRRWVVGCLAVFLVVAGVGGALAYACVIRPAMATVDAARALARLPEIEARVRNRTAFVPPADGLLTREQATRYLSAADSVRSELGVLTDRLEQRLEELKARGTVGGVRALALAYADLARTIVRAKEVQVEAINAAGFSLGEYAWVRTQVVAAAGLVPYSVDLRRVGEGGEALTELDVSVPPENVALVEELAPDVDDLAALAAFGL